MLAVFCLALNLFSLLLVERFELYLLWERVFFLSRVFLFETSYTALWQCRCRDVTAFAHVLQVESTWSLSVGLFLFFSLLSVGEFDSVYFGDVLVCSRLFVEFGGRGGVALDVVVSLAFCSWTPGDWLFFVFFVDAVL